MTDWLTWYESYDDPDSSLSRRLGIVRRRINDVLAEPAGPEPRRILSLCAGDGRDLLPELTVLDGTAYSAALVEKDETLAERALAEAEQLGLAGVTMIRGDAGLVSTFARQLPVDLLLLCGIFGNISEEDIRATIAATPAMLRPGGTVIWTRGAFTSDLRPQVRAWFREAGLRETSFDGEPEGYGVGTARLGPGARPARSLPERLFTFRR